MPEGQRAPASRSLRTHRKELGMFVDRKELGLGKLPGDEHGRSCSVAAEIDSEKATAAVNSGARRR
jgi:hypothetical protein